MTRRVRALAIVCVAIALCRGGSAQSPAVSGNLIGNAGFEQPNLAPWSASGSATTVTAAQIPPADGATSLTLGLAGSEAVQTIATTPGQAYTLAFYAAPNPADGSHSVVNEVTVTWGGAFTKRVSLVHTGGAGVPAWTRYEVTVTATDTATELRFANTSPAAGAPLLDQVSVFTNLVLNPGFETGWALGGANQVAGSQVLAPWVISGGSIVAFPDNYFPAADGLVSASFYEGHATLSQSITTVPGQAYTLSFAFAAPADPTHTLVSQAAVSWGGQQVAVVSGVHTGSVNFPQWRRYEFTVVATSTTTELAFTKTDNRIFSPNIDAVSVTLNLAGNGSFEQATLSPWSTAGAAVSVLDGTGADGTKSVAFNNASSLTQTIATVPGQSYALSFYFAPQPSDSTHTLVNQLYVLWGGTLVKAVSGVHTGAAGVPQWTRYEASVVATGTETLLTFADADPYALSPLIDQIALTASAPSSVTPPPLSVHWTFPNAGDTITISGGPLIVTWSAEGARSSFDVLLSRDGGSTFVPISECTGLPGTNTYCLWTPVAPDSANGVLRVVAHALDGSSASDDSASFPLISMVAVTSPSGGETWAAGSQQIIRWRHIFGFASASIELSRDGGATWDMIEPYASGPTDSEFSWTVTGPETSTAVIRVSVFGISALSGVFTMAGTLQPIQLLSPNGGETWQAGTTRRISFRQNISHTGRGIVEVSRDGGSSWEFAGGLELRDDTSTAQWHVTGPPTTQARIRVKWDSTPDVNDVSDADFTIIDGPPASRAAGNLVLNGSFEDRTSQNFPVPPGDTSITSWSIAGGEMTFGSGFDRRTSLMFGGRSSSVSQTVPTLVGHAYTLSFYAAPSPFDDTQSVANRLTVSWNGELVKLVTAIHTGSLSVPQWTRYEATVIAEAATSVLTFTEPDGSADQPLLDQIELSENLVANGSFEFNTPPDGNVTYTSPTMPLDAWTLDGTVDRFDPNIWPGADRGALAFTSNGASISQDVPTIPGHSYRLSYYLAAQPGGDPARIGQMNVLWNGAVVQSVSATPDLSFLPRWQRYEVTVTAVGPVSHVIFSDADAFAGSPWLDQISLTEPFAVTVDSATDSTAWVGAQSEARWSVQGTATATSFDVAYSENNGQRFIPIDGCSNLPASARSCSWIPFVDTTEGVIRVTAHGPLGAIAETESSPFEVFDLGGFIVDSPTFTSVWPVGTTKTIQWRAFISGLPLGSGPAPRVTIELSRDGGQTWETIAAEQSGDTATGSFSWEVTGPATPNAVMRIRWLDGPRSGGAGPFQITHPPTPTPQGTGVFIRPPDTFSEASPVTLTFNNVTTAGDTTLNISSNGPPLDATFRLGQPPLYYDVTTTAQYSGNIEVCVDFTGVTFPDGFTPRLLQFQNGQWVDVTTGPPTGNVICGTVTSLSLLTVAGRRDTTPPVVTCGAAAGQWHGANVSIACTAIDTGSGLANAADASFTLTTSVADGDENANAQTGSRTICDALNNCTTVGPITGNKIDRRGPSITVTAPVSGVYTLGQVVSAAYLCSDAGSGLALCQGSVASGAALDTASLGVKSFVVSAADNTGNASNVTVSYVVSLGGVVTSAGPATIWLGLKTSSDNGTKFDVRAEMLTNGVVVATGQVDNVAPGNGFGNAVQQAISAALGSATALNPGDTLGVRLSVRVAATGHRSGTARLWYNDAAANSRFTFVVNGITRTFYLNSGFALALTAGPGPKATIDVAVDRNVGGNAFKPFGTWSIVIQ